jgi:hypothetical protein
VAETGLLERALEPLTLCLPTDQATHGRSLSTASAHWKYGNPADARGAVQA